MASDIVFEKDIIKNVANRMGLPENVIKHVYHFIFPHIRKLSKQQDVFSIPMMGIGRLYMTTERMKYVLKHRENKNFVSKRQRDHHRSLKDKIDKFEDIFKNLSGDKPLYTVHKKGSALKKYNHTLKKTIKELEEFQNHGK